MSIRRFPSGSNSAALLCALLAWLGAASADAQGDEHSSRQIDLVVGEQTSISARGVQSYSEGVPGIVDVRVPSDGTRFVIVALRPGNTTLLLIMEDGSQVQYRITVRSQEQEPTGIQPRDNIRLDFYFVQLEESYGHQIGVAWPAAIGGAQVLRFNATFDFVGGAGLTDANAVVTNQPLPRIDLLETSGWARVARQAAVVTANNNEATFASGGEINVPVVGGLGNELRQIEFGSSVNVLPRYDRETGRIELRIAAEVSTLTDDRGTGVPGRSISSIETLVNLELGQAVALGGLIAEENAASQSGLPGLSQIPILGIFFFGTHGARRQYRQNVLFIVPTVVDVVSQQARARIAEAFRTYWTYSGGLGELQLLQMPETVPNAAHPDAR